MEPRDRIILALDVSDHGEAMAIVDTFRGRVGLFKVGSELFTSVGPRIVEDIHAAGGKVFLDLKFHDIPSTVSRAVAAAANLGVSMINVHAMGGLEMMSQAARTLSGLALRRNYRRPLLIAVTVLTSIDQAALRDELSVSVRMTTQVKHCAVLAQRAGLDGVVAAPEDAEMIRGRFGEGFVIVCPGIRPSWSDQDDQRRTLTPRQALSRGADYLVIGRSVTAQPDQLGSLNRILSEL